ncbi:MAG: deoxyguanosinetriphosphate triphosphohydrolase [Alphaproteobacteria bacterium]|nr:deoxyguanosinetriphosphate triphosphohydrolase [Alphaproteobacteria bacterium]
MDIEYNKNIFIESEKNMSLATYASLPEHSHGRLYPDFANIIRSPFQRDRDRLIHSSAFRRLDGKTQVFAYHEGKNYRTRLTHSIEVAQITRTICKKLNLNEELGEAIALAHDLGHAPFGHAGERGLNNSMKKFGGFDHNINSLKIMTKLERRYPEFEGLNLTWETLEGTIKHNGPITKINNKYLKEYNKQFNLELDQYSSLESQIASFADDIAYNNHDIDDGFRAGFFSIEDIRQLPFIEKIIKKFEHSHPNASDDIRIYAITRQLIADMIFDLLETTQNNIDKCHIKTSQDVRIQKHFTANFSTIMQNNINLLHQFLKEKFYTATTVARMDMKSQKIIEDLFSVFMNDYHLLPISVRQNITSTTPDDIKAENICTYIANMTDMMAVEEHKKLFDSYTRF